MQHSDHTQQLKGKRAGFHLSEISLLCSGFPLGPIECHC